MSEGELRSVQALRESGRLLPSDLLDYARVLNPGVFIDFTYDPGGRLRLTVDDHHHGRNPMAATGAETWYDVFERLGLLRRGGRAGSDEPASSST